MINIHTFEMVIERVVVLKYFYPFLILNGNVQSQFDHIHLHMSFQQTIHFETIQ